MATQTAVDAACGCGCARACHRREMRWGQAVHTSCRHHGFCHQFRPTGDTVGDPAGLILANWDAHSCLSCGARYGQPYTDHPCGLLVPVSVFIIRRPELTAPPATTVTSKEDH
ncbi:hypothetical protein ACGFIY_21150 [Micromonospora chersina]|uniref:hypothetical protein n=1 Tax=Micromonospora chersina TaxID=47854 RepID=UPI00371835A8